MGGDFDSSQTRVTPVFHALTGWVSRLLALAEYGAPDADGFAALDLRPTVVDYGATERRIPAPRALLEWLVRHVESREQDPSTSAETRAKRDAVFIRDPTTVDQALKLIADGQVTRGWHVFEGPTAPDVYIETRDAIIVIEGKRTEAGPTRYTEWMSGRHQMWRHIDAAWEIRGERTVFGLFIVEGDDTGCVPEHWRRASMDTWAEPSLTSSFPHRSPEERRQLCRCFLGVTTWQAVLREFGLAATILPATMYPAENSSS